MTIDDVLVYSEASSIKREAKGAYISLHFDGKDIVFYWVDGNGEKSHRVYYDGSDKFKEDFRNLMESRL